MTGRSFPFFLGTEKTQELKPRESELCTCLIACFVRRELTFCCSVICIEGDTGSRWHHSLNRGALLPENSGV